MARPSRLAGELLCGGGRLRLLPRRRPGDLSAGQVGPCPPGPPGQGGVSLFSGFMMSAWIVASIVAVVAGVVGFFVVMRGSAFAAHALPQSAFTGAAAASLIGISTVYGMGAFALTSALGIAWLG